MSRQPTNSSRRGRPAKGRASAPTAKRGAGRGAKRAASLPAGGRSARSRTSDATQSPRRAAAGKPADPSASSPLRTRDRVSIATVLTPAQRRQLRALAHALKPVVQVGQHGITDAVVQATDEALCAHELIKARMYEPDAKQTMAADLARRTSATLCGVIGHTAILYRPDPDTPRIVIARAKPASAGAAAARRPSTVAAASATTRDKVGS